MTYAPNARGLAAPARIWAELPDLFDGMGFWQENARPDLVRYIREDIAPDTDHIEHLAQERDRFADRIDDLAALLMDARALFLAADPGSIETQRRIAAFLEATE